MGKADKWKAAMGGWGEVELGGFTYPSVHGETYDVGSVGGRLSFCISEAQCVPVKQVDWRD